MRKILVGGMQEKVNQGRDSEAFEGDVRYGRKSRNRWRVRNKGRRKEIIEMGL